MKLPLILLTATLGSLSSAAINLNLDRYLWENNGYLPITVTGTITLQSGWDLFSVQGDAPSNGTDYLSASFAPELMEYLALDTSAPYSGPILVTYISKNVTPGLYDLGDAIGGPMAELSFGAKNSARSLTAYENEFYAVQINAVPEPASMATLGLATVALIRRRKRT